MLSKDKRLNLKTDFKWVAAGKKLETKFLKLFLRLGDNQAPRVGIAGSAKVFKKAHDRNRARRLTSAVFEVLYSKLPQSINIVAMPKEPIINVSSGDVLIDVEEVLRKEKIILN